MSDATIDATIMALETVFGGFRDEHGVGEREIAAAEARLDIVLPRALRTLYARTGRHPLHSSNDRLVAPSDLEFEDGHLVFYEESQNTTAWGISELSTQDPPVAALVLGPDGLRFAPEFISVSQFLGFEAAHQATSGALPISGLVLSGRSTSRTSRESIARTLSRPTTEILVSTESAEVRYSPGAICLVANAYLGLAAQDIESFEALANRIGLHESDWSYYSTRDSL